MRQHDCAVVQDNLPVTTHLILASAQVIWSLLLLRQQSTDTSARRSPSPPYTTYKILFPPKCEHNTSFTPFERKSIFNSHRAACVCLCTSSRLRVRACVCVRTGRRQNGHLPAAPPGRRRRGSLCALFARSLHPETTTLRRSLVGPQRYRPWKRRLLRVSLLARDLQLRRAQVSEERA